MRQSEEGGCKDKISAMSAKAEAGVVFVATEWYESSRLMHLLKQHVGYSPLGALKVEEERRRVAEVEWALRTVHPNPGPRTEAERVRRRVARKERRRRRRAERERVAAELAARGAVVKEELVVVAWNVQGMSLENLARRKLKMVASYLNRFSAQKCPYNSHVMLGF